MYLVKEIENSWESLDNNIAIFEDFPKIQQIRKRFYRNVDAIEYIQLINGERIKYKENEKEYFLSVEKINFNIKYKI